MSSQVQCPNCGGYKVSPAKLSRIDPQTGKAMNTAGFSCLLTIAGTFIFWLTVIALVYLGINTGIAIVAGIALTIGVGVMISNNRLKNAINVTTFQCDICGHVWHWRHGTPMPKAMGQPNVVLINATNKLNAAVRCKCNNTIPEGYPYCPYCGTPRDKL